MPSLHPRELGRVPDLHPGVLQGMPRSEGRLAHEASVRCLLVISDMPVSEPGVLGAVLGVEVAVGHQMRLRHALVVLNMAMLNVYVFGCVPASRAHRGRPVLLRHDDHLASRDDIKGTLLFAVEDEEDRRRTRPRHIYDARLV
jgi:hypothetical protein